MPSRKRLIRQEEFKLQQDEYEETVALNEVGLFLSLTEACLKSKIEPLSTTQWASYTVKKDRKGNVIEKVPCTVRVKDAMKDDTWNKFLAAKGYTNEQLIHLADTDKLTSEYFPWIQDFGERYHNLDPLDKQEFQRGIRKGIKWRILENMYLGWLRCPNKSDPDEDYFINDDLRRTYERSYHARIIGLPGDAKVTHAASKDQENKEFAKELIHNHHEERAKQLADPAEMEKALREIEARKNEKRKQRRKGNDDTGEVAV